MKYIHQLVVGFAALAVSAAFAEDIDLTADFRTAYESDNSLISYTDNGHNDIASSAYTLFDGNLSVRWLSPTAYPNWIEVGVSDAFIASKGGKYPAVRKFKIYAIKNGDRLPNVFYLQVSDDQRHWKNVLSVNGGITWISNAAEFTLPRPAMGKYFRLFLIESEGGKATYKQFQEIYLYGSYETKSIEVCEGLDIHGMKTSSFVFDGTEGDEVTITPRADFTVGATTYTCTGYKLETSTDDGGSWLETASSAKSVTLQRGATRYRVTWLWQESPAGATVDVAAGTDLSTVAFANGSTYRLAEGLYTVSTSVQLTALTNVTIIGSGRVVITTPDSFSGNAFVISDCGKLKLENLRFQECVNLSSSGDVHGSAVKIENSSEVFFCDCLFRGNIAMTTVAGTANKALGGAIYASSVTKLLFNNCAFNGNRGQYVASDYADSSSIKYQTQGGAIYTANCEAQYIGCRFTANRVLSPSCGNAGGGGVFAEVDAAASYRELQSDFLNCRFFGNGAHNRSAAEFATFKGVKLYNHNGYSFDTLSYLTSNGAAIRGYCLYVLDSIFADNFGISVYYDSEASAKKGYGAVTDNVFCERYRDVRVNEKTETVTISDNETCPDLDIRGYAGAGRDFWVATDGNDAASGTESAPFATIAKAVSLADDGDRIHLKAGTYGTNETFPIVIRGIYDLTIEGVGEVVVNANSPDNARVFTLVDCAAFTLKNMTVTGGHVCENYGRGGGILAIGCEGLVFDHVKVNGNEATTSDSSSGGFAGAGVCISDGSISLSDCEVSSNTVGTLGYQLNAYAGGMAVYDSSVKAVRTLFADNLVNGNLSGSHHAYGGGVYVAAKDDIGISTVFENCVFDKNKFCDSYASQAGRGVGSAIDSTMQSVMLNCTIRSSGCAKCTPVAGAIALTNCVSYGHTAYDFGSAVTGANNAYGIFTSVPDGFGIQLESSPFDGDTYIPAKDSPLVDAGCDVGFTAADKDFLGKSRIFGAAIDIGAVELCTAKGLLIIYR